MGWKRKLAITVVLLGGIGGLGYYSYSSGWLEKTLSEAVIPFEFFRVDEKRSVRDLAVKDDQRKSIAEYKQELEPLLSLFNGTEERPTLNDKVDVIAFTDMLDPIYGVEYQYVGSAVMSGLYQDKDGWAPLVTFSVFNDSETVRNITMAVRIKDGVLSPTVIRDSSDDFAYSELPSDFNLSLLDLSTSSDRRFYDEKIWEKGTVGYTDEQIAQLKEANNQVKTQTLLVYSDAAVHQVHKYGTTQHVYTVDRVFTLDSLSNNKNLMAAPMTITRDE